MSEIELPPLVLLAAGASSRTLDEIGRPKGLISVRGRPWLQVQLETFADAGGTRAVIVLGHHREAILAAVPALDRATSEWTALAGLQVRTAINPQPDRGPFSSLQTGLHVLESEDVDAFVLPVDVPAASRPVWTALAAAGAPAAVPQIDGRGGHPVLVARKLIDHLLQLDPAAPDARLDVQLHEAGSVRVAVTDRRIHGNLNTADDWSQFLNDDETESK